MGRERSGSRKVQQVCREVERTLSVALGASDDDLLASLSVLAVDPAPDASRLMVTVFTSTPGVEAAALLERLERLRPALRAEVAASLQRKRTPELAFRVAPPPMDLT